MNSQVNQTNNCTQVAPVAPSPNFATSAATHSRSPSASSGLSATRGSRRNTPTSHTNTGAEMDTGAKDFQKSELMNYFICPYGKLEPKLYRHCSLISMSTMDRLRFHLDRLHGVQVPEEMEMWAEVFLFCYHKILGSLEVPVSQPLSPNETSDLYTPPSSNSRGATIDSTAPSTMDHCSTSPEPKILKKEKQDMDMLCSDDLYSPPWKPSPALPSINDVPDQKPQKSSTPEYITIPSRTPSPSPSPSKTPNTPPELGDKRTRSSASISSVVKGLTIASPRRRRAITTPGPLACPFSKGDPQQAVNAKNCQRRGRRSLYNGANCERYKAINITKLKLHLRRSHEMEVPRKVRTWEGLFSLCFPDESPPSPTPMPSALVSALVQPQQLQNSDAPSVIRNSECTVVMQTIPVVDPLTNQQTIVSQAKVQKPAFSPTEKEDIPKASSHFTPLDSTGEVSTETNANTLPVSTQSPNQIVINPETEISSRFPIRDQASETPRNSIERAELEDHLPEESRRRPFLPLYKDPPTTIARPDTPTKNKHIICIARSPIIPSSRETALPKKYTFSTLQEFESGFDDWMESQFFDPLFEWAEWQLEHPRRGGLLLSSLQEVLTELEFTHLAYGGIRVAMNLVLRKEFE